MKKSKIKLIILISLLILFILYLLWADKALTIRSFDISDEDIPSAFDNYSIVQVSDLHNATFGSDNEKLLSMIASCEPDIIAVTGDVIDSRRTDTEVAKAFFKKALEIAPVYYVTGNHEFRIDNTDSFLADIKKLGVNILENESVTLSKGDGKINLCGASDPTFTADYLIGEEEYVLAYNIEKLKKENSFNLLLSHRPEFLEAYTQEGFDLVLSGHAHGGQFRLPVIGGFIAPGQGLFPQYDSGLYENDNTKMIVSRGLGNSIIPLRVFNRPEIIKITLKSE